MSLTIPQCEALRKLYPSVVNMYEDKAYDAEGN